MLDVEEKQQSISADDVTTDDENRQLLEINDDNAFNIDETLSNHNSILQFTKQIALYWLIIDIGYKLFYAARWYLWLLFSRYLGQHNEVLIAWTINALFIIQATSILFWATMGDKYGYDKIAMISCLFTLIGLSLESFAPSFPLFLTGSIITASFRALNALTMGIITKYLPSYWAIKYMSYRYSLISAGNLLGPVIGGLIAYLINIRSTFIFATIISFISLLIMLIKVNGAHKKMHKEQVNIKWLYNYIKVNNDNIVNLYDGNNKDELLLLSNEDHQFPINTETYISQNASQSKSRDIYEWYMTIMIVIANGCLIGTEGVLSTFYVVFCLDLLNLTTFTSTLHIAIFSLFFIFSCLIVPRMVNKFKNKNNLLFEYIIIIIGHIVVILILFSYKPILTLFGPISLWILMPITGFLNGFTNMTQEIVLLVIQRKKHAAKIAGFKVFMRNSMKGIASFFVALYWETDYYWFVYGQIMLYLFSLLCMIAMIIAQILLYRL